MITEEDKVPVANKNGRVVVLKHMFTLKELETDKSLLLDLKEDVREEASTLGEVTNVVLYDVGFHPIQSLRPIILMFVILFIERVGRNHDSEIPRSSIGTSMCIGKFTVLSPSPTANCSHCDSQRRE